MSDETDIQAALKQSAEIARKQSQPHRCHPITVLEAAANKTEKGQSISRIFSIAHCTISPVNLNFPISLGINLSETT
jgi:hypothetical protein